MTIYDVLCPWNKETEIVIKCRKLSYNVDPETLQRVRANLFGGFYCEFCI